MTSAVDKAKAKRAAAGKAGKKPAADKKAAAEAKVQEAADAAETARAKAFTTLETVAKEVNKRMESFAKKAKDANDQRLAAALRMAEAKALCEKNKIKFADWCDENIDQSYESARKLAIVGAAPDPALAIEDMRLKNKEANKKSRDKDKKARDKVKKADATKAAAEAGDGAATEAEGPLSAMRAIYDELDEEQRDEIFFWIAEDRGYDLGEAAEEAPEEKTGEEGAGTDDDTGSASEDDGSADWE